jgi:cysteine desulfurase
MLECHQNGLAISTRRPCSVGTEKASATMVALDRSEQEVREFIRLSLGRSTTKEELDKAVKILKNVLTEHFNMVKL